MTTKEVFAHTGEAAWGYISGKFIIPVMMGLMTLGMAYIASEQRSATIVAKAAVENSDARAAAVATELRVNLRVSAEVASEVKNNAHAMKEQIVSLRETVLTGQLKTAQLFSVVENLQRAVDAQTRELNDHEKRLNLNDGARGDPYRSRQP